MRVSVVVPTYLPDRYADFTECIDALLAQTYDDVEVVIIIDGNGEMHDRARDEYGDRGDVVIYACHEDAGPISRANMGAVQASGDLVAITDLDAVAEPDWIEQLVDAYERHDAIAVGGRIEPDWVAGEAEYIPEEFHFLIGATYRGFPDEEGEVRNTFGANLAFDRDVFLKLGGVKLGGIDPSQVQGRESELCARMRRQYGRGVIYNPDAVVHHKIYQHRTEYDWLLKRAFWQGYSKRAMASLVPGESDDESKFARNLFLKFLPDRVWGALTRRSEHATEKLLMLVTLTAATAFGYFWGLVRWR